MMAKRSAFGVIVATEFIRSSNADPSSGSRTAKISGKQELTSQSYYSL